MKSLLVAPGIFQINIAVSTFQHPISTLGTPRDTPDLPCANSLRRDHKYYIFKYNKYEYKPCIYQVAAILKRIENKIQSERKEVKSTHIIVITIVSERSNKGDPQREQQGQMVTTTERSFFETYGSGSLADGGRFELLAGDSGSSSGRFR
ncbi:hypothetical protein KSP40_PGU005896 [Platanthera guangdongensis]|uniref:Uncharacterized protein n=1 Tax=Platanthera guangdongensis TaxID=2320717 RepID=A0ABR2MV93_9ASPA